MRGSFTLTLRSLFKGPHLRNNALNRSSWVVCVEWRAMQFKGEGNRCWFNSGASVACEQKRFAVLPEFSDPVARFRLSTDEKKSFKS